MRLDATPDASAISVTPATYADIDWVSALQQQLFGATAVPLAILRDWYATNPSGFRVVRAAGERIGHVDVLPVKPEALQRFTDGVIEERALRGADLHPPAERGLVRDLYLESVVVRGASKAVHDAGVAALVEALPSIYASLGEPARLRWIYAVAFGPAGSRFLQKIGFEPVAAAGERVDGMPLYRAAGNSFFT
jgi:hypothetical protein